MLSVFRQTQVPYTPLQMFELVNDVERYPQFVPWCVSAQVLSQDEEKVMASLFIAKGLFRSSFTTVNRLTQERCVEMQLIQGPFNHLAGKWEFQEVPVGTKVTFSLSWEWQNAWLSWGLKPWLETAADTLVEAFALRARELYASS